MSIKRPAKPMTGHSGAPGSVPTRYITSTPVPLMVPLEKLRDPVKIGDEFIIDIFDSNTNEKIAEKVRVIADPSGVAQIPTAKHGK